MSRPLDNMTAYCQTRPYGGNFSDSKVFHQESSDELRLFFRSTQEPENATRMQASMCSRALTGKTTR